MERRHVLAQQRDLYKHHAATITRKVRQIRRSISARSGTGLRLSSIIDVEDEGGSRDEKDALVQDEAGEEALDRPRLPSRRGVPTEELSEDGVQVS